MMTKTLFIIGLFPLILSTVYSPDAFENISEYDPEPEIHMAGFFPRSSRGAFSPFNRTIHEKRPYKIKKDLSLKDDPDYQELLSKIFTLLIFQEYDAYKSIDNIEVLTNWQVGAFLVNHIKDLQRDPEYETRLISNLSVDLNIDKRKLYRMIAFYKMYKNISKVSRKLSWQHYTILITIENDNIRMFFQEAALDNAWDVNELQRYIKKMYPINK